MAELKTTSVAPAPIDLTWKMARKGNEILPKVLPEYFANVEILEGGGSDAGTVRLVTLGEAAGDDAGKKVKEHYDVVDDATHTITYSLVEGGNPCYPTMQFTLRFTSEGPDSTTVESIVNYTTADDSVPPPTHLKALVDASNKAMAVYAKEHASEFQ